LGNGWIRYLETNQKVLYQLWTDGKGSFAIKKNEEDSQFEYSDSQEPEKYSNSLIQKCVMTVRYLKN
jgi:hypothetical protein